MQRKCPQQKYRMYMYTLTAHNISEYKVGCLFTMPPNLSLDPSNPPRYCPQCASKVKKMKVEKGSLKLTIMCKNEKVKLSKS